jgi:hypothetical protein
MPLPTRTTAEDVRRIVRYLKTKPTGAAVVEAKAALQEVMDARKVAAYVFWDVVTKDGEKIKLSSRGWEFARKPDSETHFFLTIIDSIVPYRSVLEWAHHQNLDSISNADVGAHWHEHHSEALGTENETTIKDSAVCFFHLCQAASLGTLNFGRKGQPTRLVLDRDVLQKHIEEGPTAPPWVDPSSEEMTEAPSKEEQRGNDEESLNNKPPRSASLDTAQASSIQPAQPEKLRVFISHGKNKGIVDQVQTMLDLADIESEVAEKEESTAIPVPDKVFNAMRRCQAGIITVTVEEGRRDKEDNYVLNENVLIEIGAAFVLYERRVVLLWDKRLAIPSNLQGLYRCEFEGDDLTWAAGMKLMKAIQGFKR